MKIATPTRFNSNPDNHLTSPFAPKCDSCVPRFCAGTRKSFRRLLLSLFVPVSPLGAHSYKKIGGIPPSPSKRRHVGRKTTNLVARVPRTRGLPLNSNIATHLTNSLRTLRHMKRPITCNVIRLAISPPSRHQRQSSGSRNASCRAAGPRLILITSTQGASYA